VADWRWFGHPGHFCCGSDCRFHLTTLAGHYMVSTVGEYVPDSNVRDILARCRNIELEGQGDERLASWMRQSGFEELGHNRIYETMVFPAGKPCHTRQCGCGLPEILFPDVDMAGYQTPAAATLGHYALCEKWQDVEPEEGTHTPEESRKMLHEAAEEIRLKNLLGDGWEPDDG